MRNRGDQIRFPAGLRNRRRPLAEIENQEETLLGARDPPLETKMSGRGPCLSQALERISMSKRPGGQGQECRNDPRCRSAQQENEGEWYGCRSMRREKGGCQLESREGPFDLAFDDHDPVQIHLD